MREAKASPLITPEIIKRMRERLGETQMEFAVRVGVKQSALSRWESGRLPKRAAQQMLLTRVLAEIERVIPTR